MQADTTTVFSAGVDPTLLNLNDLQENPDLLEQLGKLTLEVNQSHHNVCFNLENQLMYGLLKKNNFQNIENHLIKIAQETLVLFYKWLHMFKYCVRNHPQNVRCSDCIFEIQTDLVNFMKLFLGITWEPPLNFCTSSMFIVKTNKQMWSNCKICSGELNSFNLVEFWEN